MPTPTAAILAAIQNILVDHNVLEEGADGLYETCDALAGPETESTMAALRAAPDVTVMPYNDSPAVMNVVRRALERAGYHLREQNPERARDHFHFEVPGAQLSVSGNNFSGSEPGVV